jgi:hypothetical protein
MNILLILLVVVVAMIIVGALLGKLTWERAITLVLVVAVVGVAIYILLTKLA